MATNKLAKGCGIGCVGVIALAIGFGLIGHFALKNLTPEQRAALHADTEARLTEQQTSDDAVVDAFLAKFHDLYGRLPRRESIKEQLCPATNDEENIAYLPVDQAFLAQFASGTFQPASPPEHPWYRGGLIADVQGSLQPGGGFGSRDKSGLVAQAEYFKRIPYYVVFIPEEARWPVLDADGKTFQTGVFRGWAVLVDAKSMTPLGQTPFTVQNSPEVTSLRFGLGSERFGTSRIGADLKNSLENDFTGNFWKAADAAVVHLRQRPGGKTSASHENDFAATR